MEGFVWTLLAGVGTGSQFLRSKAVFVFFCVEVKATKGNISNTGCILGMKTLACAVKDCLVVMNQNNVSWLTSHKSWDLVCLCVCVCV